MGFAPGCGPSYSTQELEYERIQLYRTVTGIPPHRIFRLNCCSGIPLHRNPVAVVYWTSTTHQKLRCQSYGGIPPHRISVELEIHYISATVNFGVWWKSSTELQLKFDGVEFHLSSDTVIFGVWWKSSTQLQPEFDEVEFHFSSSTVIFGVWWKSSTQLQPDFDEVEFHCSNSIKFQLQFDITEFVCTLTDTDKTEYSNMIKKGPVGMFK